jgi:hypothetical protein
MDVVNRTITLYSSSVVEQTRGAADLVILPPVAAFRLAEMKSYVEIIRIGYEHATKQLEELDRTGGFNAKRIAIG